MISVTRSKLLLVLCATTLLVGCIDKTVYVRENEVDKPQDSGTPAESEGSESGATGTDGGTGDTASPTGTAGTSEASTSAGDGDTDTEG